MYGFVIGRAESQTLHIVEYGCIQAGRAIYQTTVAFHQEHRRLAFACVMSYELSHTSCLVAVAEHDRLIDTIR